MGTIEQLVVSWTPDEIKTIVGDSDEANHLANIALDELHEVDDPDTSLKVTDYGDVIVSAAARGEASIDTDDVANILYTHLVENASVYGYAANLCSYQRTVAVSGDGITLTLTSDRLVYETAETRAETERRLEATANGRDRAIRHDVLTAAERSGAERKIGYLLYLLGETDMGELAVSNVVREIASVAHEHYDGDVMRTRMPNFVRTTIDEAA